MIWTIYNGILSQMNMGQKGIHRKGTFSSIRFCKKMIGLLKVFISHGVNNALKMLIKFMYWMFLGINADIELYSDSSKKSLESLIDLLKWTDKFQKVNLPKIRNLLAPYSCKVIE